MDEKDGLELMFGGTWTVYILTLLIVYLLSKQKMNKQTITVGLFISVGMSIIGPLLIRDNRLGLIAPIFGPFVILIITPLLLLYSAIIVCILKNLRLNAYFIVPYIITGIYLVSLLLSTYTDRNIMVIWNWLYGGK